MQGSLYIVDALNFLFRAFHALPPLITSRGIATGAVYGFCQMLLRLEREQRPTHICVVFDAPGRTFRDDLHAGYKANRPAMPPDLSAQVALAHQLVEAFGIQVLSVPGVEADDVIATLARLAAASGLKVVVCSSDKDLMQIIRDNVQVLDTMNNRLLGHGDVMEKFGVPPERVGDLLALTGDSIDNIPGVAGIGPKTAAELLGRFGSLDELLARLHEVKGKKGEAIAAARERVRLARRLVDLREDVPLPKALVELARKDPDRPRLQALFRELEFTRLLVQLAAGEAGASIAGGEGRGEGGPAATVVLDAEALAELLAALERAGGFGVAALSEGQGTRAALLGFGFALPDGARFYLPLGHRVLGGPATLREPEALEGLRAPLASERLAKHVHDGKSIDILLRERGAALGGVVSDTMLAAYLLDATRTRYDLDVVAAGLEGVAARAAWLGSGSSGRPPSEVPVEEAGRRLGAEAAAALVLASMQEARLRSAGLLDLYRSVELPLAHVLARAECTGVRLDVGHLRRLGEEVVDSLRGLEREIHQLAGTEFNIASPKQLGAVLFDRLGLPVLRRTKTGPSTDADVLEELAALHPVPVKILDYRTVAKLKGTYIDVLPALVNPRTGRLHTTFNQAVAATGRLSSSDPNLQNIPIRSELGRRIREAFVADPGFAIVAADYSQIELRILAHFSEDPAFLEAFRSGDDIHQRTAAQVFSVQPEAVSADQRRIAKAINFGLVFGQTDFGLAQALRIPRAEARAYIESYFARYIGVRAYMDRAIAEARAAGEVTTLLGRRRAISEINGGRPADRAYGERIARNTPIQGSAADLLKMAMIRVDRGLAAWPDARLLLTVHDELVFEVKAEAVEAFSAWVKHEMEAVCELRVPLVVEVGAGRTWGEAH